jgi:hypothetical protein
MSLVDTLLARRSVMFTSPHSMVECRDRIGPNSTPSAFGSGANGASPFIVNWRGESEVTLTKPWSKWETRRRPQCSLRVRFDAQADGTFVEVTAGVAPGVVLSYSLFWLFWLFVAGYAVANWSSVLHSPGGNPLLALGFCGLLGPWLLFCARSTVVRQAPDLVSTLESVLGAVTSPAL